MAEVVVDSDVVSYVFKGDDRAELYAPHLNGTALVLSFMTLAELYRRPLEHNWERKRRAKLQRLIGRFTVRYVDDALCQFWAAAVSDAARHGFKVPTGDAWNAATAIAYGVPLVTHHPKHYRGITGLKIITEAKP
jgi:tRNA(fMet)-specific endonuclease VapC